MSGPQSQARITSYLSNAVRIKSERPVHTSMFDGSSPHSRAQTQPYELHRDSSANIAPLVILQADREQTIERNETDPGMNGMEQVPEGMEAQEHRSLRSGSKNNSSTTTIQRRAKRTRDELRELAETGDAEAAAELETMLEKGRQSQKKRSEQAAAGIPSAVASKEKDRKHGRDLTALRSSTAQLKQQIDNGDKAAVGTLQLLQEGYLAKYPKSKVFKVSSGRLGTANIEVVSGSLTSSNTQKQAKKKPTKRKAIVDDQEGKKTQKQAAKKPAKRKAIADVEEGNKTQDKATGKRAKRKLVVDDSEDDDEDKTLKKRDDQPKPQEKLVVLPVQEKEAVVPKLRWHKGRTIRSSHDQHGQPSPQAASPNSASVAALNATDAEVEAEATLSSAPVENVETEAVMPQPSSTQTEHARQVTALPKGQPPAANNNTASTSDVIVLDDPEVEFVESRPVFNIFKNTSSTNTMSSIYNQLGSFKHRGAQQQNDDDDVEYTKLQIRKKEIEEEKDELQLKLHRQERAQAVREVLDMGVESFKVEMPQREGAAKVE